ncbi:MAG TPA: PilZ domain-containing protein [Kofleriaceae bacterium]|nr:PilZ domain-containing protein [Kofleriaceae bacterium]
MKDEMGGRPERRRHARVMPKGTVTLRAGREAQHARIVNLGEGGMFAATDVRAPDRLLRRAVDLEIRLDGASAQWLRGTGRVVRIVAEGVAIAFDTLPSGLLRMIDELTTASHARRRVMSVVLIDADAERRSAMASAFRTTGCAIVEATTPLEAIVRLGESSFEPDVIAVADSGSATTAADLRAFVERNHASAKLIAIGDDPDAPDGIIHWLSSADPEGDLPSRIRAVLARPRRWTRP